MRESFKRVAMVTVVALWAWLGCVEARAESFDWRNVDGKNFMTPAKAQGLNECRTFAGIAAMEAKIKIVLNNPTIDIDLSERQMIYHAPGTNGFSLFSAEWYNGILKEEDMPYEINPPVFPPNWMDMTYTITAISPTLTITNEQAQRETIQTWLKEYGPLYTENWHGNTLVGYNDDDEYWIFKETYGAGAGDNGYFTYDYGYMQGRFMHALTGDVYYAGELLVPEPATLGLMILGGLALSTRSRLRRRRRSA